MKCSSIMARKNARGMVLIVALIMLGLLTLIVAALVTTGNINFRIAGNQQYRQEARVTAQNAIETYISTATNFSSPPTTTITTGTDLDGDGNNEFVASVPPPTCVGLRLVKENELDRSKASDRNCLKSLSSDQDQSSDSMQTKCADVVWDVEAQVQDTATTGVDVEVHQGVSVRSNFFVSCP